MSKTRREFLRHLLASGGLIVAGSGAVITSFVARGRRFEPLQAADANNVRLPPGFRSRIVAVSGQAPVEGGSPWHAAPDGGAVFASRNGGWIYVSNSEVASPDGGVGALVFDADGNVVDAYPVLSGTARNCAGGPTPWDTWLSCEEVADGAVWECDPHRTAVPVRHDAMGWFRHEAAAVDPVSRTVFMTEDRADGLLYRFVPSAYPDLSAGTLQCAEVMSGSPATVVWHDVPNPNPASADTETRHQANLATPFNRGEGMWIHEQTVYFSTTGDNRVWAYDAKDSTLELIYDAGTANQPALTNPDNLTVSDWGGVFVAEDPGNLQIVLLTRDGHALPIMELVGHDGSEITGPAFDPSGRRLYFSSQDGAPDGGIGDGVTFEIEGPFPELIFASGFE